MGIFSCPCCVCPAGVCSRREQKLVKTFTTWQILASWQVLGAVSEAVRYWGIFFAENIGSTATVQGDILSKE